MYKPHPWAPTPSDPELAIWRYIPYSRWVDLVETKELHFTRLDQYTDEWEGLLPEGTIPLPKDGFTGKPRRPDDELTDFQMHLRSVGLLNKLCGYVNC
jgi:hypothetical protein